MPSLELIPTEAVLHVQAGDPRSVMLGVSYFSARSGQPLPAKEVQFKPTFTESFLYSVVLNEPRDASIDVRPSYGDSANASAAPVKTPAAAPIPLAIASATSGVRPGENACNSSIVPPMAHKRTTRRNRLRRPRNARLPRIASTK